MTERVEREVRMPDGSVHSFRVPSDANDDEIKEFALDWWSQKEGEPKSPSPITPAEKAGASVTGAVGSSAAGAAGAIGAGWLLRKALPFLRPTRSYLEKLDSALHDEMSTNLGEVWKNYENHVSSNGFGPGSKHPTPTLYDFISKDIERAPRVKKILGEAMDAPAGERIDKPIARALTSDSPAPNEIAKDLKERAGARRERIMNSLAEGFGIPKASLTESEEALKAERAANAKPLYDQAFKYKGPMGGTQWLDLYSQHAGAMADAIKSVRKNADINGDLDTVIARSPGHKLFWRNPVNPDDVPQGLLVGELKNKSQRYFQPSVQDLHRIREQLWHEYSTAKRAEDPARQTRAGAYLEAWKGLTEHMNQYAPQSYRFARERFKSDSDILKALEQGEGILNSDPRDVTNMLAKMGPDEKAAVGRGLYGYLSQQQDPKFIKDLVKGDPTAARPRQVIDQLFPDQARRDNFLKSLSNEEILAAGEAKAPPSTGPGDHLGARTRIIERGLEAPSLWGAITNFAPPYDPKHWVNKRGSELLFSKPQLQPGGGGISNPDIESYLRGYGWDRTLTGGLGAAAGLGGYGLYNSDE